MQKVRAFRKTVKLNDAALHFNTPTLYIASRSIGQAVIPMADVHWQHHMQGFPHRIWI